MLKYTNEEHLMMTNVELRQRAATRRIYEQMLLWHKKRETQRNRERAALRIQTFFRMRKEMNQSFINALDLKTYPRIYILKEQKPIFIKIIKGLMPLFRSKHELEFEQLMDCLKEDTKFDTIRVTEPDMFPKRSLPLLQFLKPI